MECTPQRKSWLRPYGSPVINLNSFDGVFDAKHNDNTGYKVSSRHMRYTANVQGQR